MYYITCIVLNQNNLTPDNLHTWYCVNLICLYNTIILT